MLSASSGKPERTREQPSNQTWGPVHPSYFFIEELSDAFNKGAPETSITRNCKVFKTFLTLLFKEVI